MTEEPPTAVIEDTEVSLTGVAAEKIYQGGKYGELEKGKLKLMPVEALYLVKQGKLKVVDPEGVPLDFQELVSRFSEKDPLIWARFLIYQDLRRRGYTVKAGYGKGAVFRVYRRGAKIGSEPARYLVFGVAEGETFDVAFLAKIADEARSSQKDLILAVIDRQGDITYYDVSRVSL
ncbi:MAG: tRNA-intron lyase [Candidatus Verstraetearchaeota archaeon]|nr:tRNA-intron lyase [Candidatus Verstraetearchaeota archaeon]